MNSLVGQIKEDAAHIDRAMIASHIDADKIALLRNRAQGILNKLDTYSGLERGKPIASTSAPCSDCRDEAICREERLCAFAVR